MGGGGGVGGGAPGCGRDGALTGTNITGNNDLVRNISLSGNAGLKRVWKCFFGMEGGTQLEDITIYLKMIRSGLFQWSRIPNSVT